MRAGGDKRASRARTSRKPCQNLQGALITRERRHQWFDWMREADEAGIEWDGAM
jgi:hypothetical protein